MAYDLLIPKLAILRYLDATRFELTGDLLSRVFLENGWADYFTLQQALSDLSESGMLYCAQRPQGICYRIAPAGQQTFEQFQERLPYSMRKQIDAYAENSRLRVQNEAHSTAVSRRIGPGEYEVECRVVEEDRVLLSLCLNVTSAELAASLANRWTEKAPEVYSALWKALTD